MARFRYGNSSASSIIRSAASANSKVQSLQDTEAKFNWDFGPQDAGALKTYQDYAKGRMDSLSKLGDPGSIEKAITFQKDIFSAQKAYGTTQMRQASIDIMEGNATQADKVAKLRALTMQSTQFGDQQLTLELHQQYDTAAKTLYDQNVANAKAAAASSAAGQVANKDQMTNDLMPMYDQIRALAENLRQNGQVHLGGKDNTFSVISSIYQQGILPTLQHYAENGLLSPAETTKVLNQVSDITNGHTALTVLDASGSAQSLSTILGKGFTLPQLNDTAIQTSNGNSPFDVHQGDNGDYTLKQRYVVDTQWVTDQNGQAHLRPVYGSDLQVTDQSKSLYQKVQSQLQAKSKADPNFHWTGGVSSSGSITPFEVQNPNDPNSYVQLIVRPDGSVNFVGAQDQQGNIAQLGRLKGDGSPEFVSQQEFQGMNQDFLKQQKDQQNGQTDPTKAPAGMGGMGNIAGLSHNGQNASNATGLAGKIGSDIMGIGHGIESVGGGIGGLISGAADMLTGVSANRAAQAKAQSAAMQAAQQKMMQQAMAQVKQVQATPLSQPLPSNIGAAARYLGEPLPAPFLKTAPVFTGPNLTGGQQTINAMSGINNAAGFNPPKL